MTINKINWLILLLAFHAINCTASSSSQSPRLEAQRSSNNLKSQNKTSCPASEIQRLHELSIIDYLHLDSDYQEAATEEYDSQSSEADSFNSTGHGSLLYGCMRKGNARKTNDHGSLDSLSSFTSEDGKENIGPRTINSVESVSEITDDFYSSDSSTLIYTSDEYIDPDIILD